MLVGSAEVKIHADVTGLAKDIEAQIQRLNRTGTGIGQNIGKNIREGIKTGIGDLPTVLSGNLGKMEDEGEKAGDAFGKGFLSGARVHLRSLGSLVDGEALGSQLASEMTAGFGGSLDLEDGINRQLSEAASNAGTAGDMAASNFERGFTGRQMNLDMDFGGSGSRGGNSFGKGFSDAFDGWMSTRTSAPFEDMIKGILSNLIPLQVLQGIIVGLVGAVSSLASAFVALTSAAAYAAPAILKFGNVLGAVGQGAIVLGSVFKNVGSAISSVTKAQEAAAKASDGSRKSALDEAERLMRIKQARDALNDAILEGARSNQDAVERVSDAHEALRDAVEGVSDAQEGLRDAIEGVSDAEENLSDAIRAEERALRSIDQARADAQERIEDLQMALERGSLTEERAALNLKKAEQQLASARAGGNANAIYEADLAYREQAQSLKEVRERNGDLRKESNEAQRAGVDGAQAVLDAQEAYLDAVEKTSDAQEAHRDALEKVRDAQEAISDSLERQSDAQLALKRAMEDVPRVAEDAALRIAAAQLALKRALEQKVDPAVTKAVDAVDDAFAKLAPAAQAFVRYWTGTVLPLLQSIQREGQQEFFTGLNEAVKNLVESTEFVRILRETFVSTSDALGDIAVQLSEAFTEPATLKALETILDSNVVILRNLGTAAANLVRPLSQIFAATAPLAEAWSKSVADATETFSNFINGKAQGGEDSELNKFFQQASEIAGQFWSVLKNITKGVGGIFEAALGPGRYFLGLLEQMTSQWSDRMNDPKNQDAMSKTFSAAATNAEKLLKVVGGIIGVLFRLGANPAIGDLADSVTKALPAFEALANDALEQIAPALSKIIEAIPAFGRFFTESGAVQAFADTVATVVEKIGELLDFLLQFDGVKNALKFLGQIVGVGLAFKLFSGILGFGIQKLKGYKDGLVKMKDGIKGIPNAFKDISDSVKNATGKLTGFFKKLGAGKKARKDAENNYWFDQGSLGTKSGAKQAGKQAAQKAKVEVQTDVDAAKLKRDMDKAVRDGVASASKSLREEAAKAKVEAQYLGTAAGEGIEKGIRESYPELARVSQGAASEIINAIKKALGIRSPSTVMEQQVGDQAVAGIMRSFTEADFNVAAKQLVTEIETELKQAATGLVDAGTAMGNSVEQGLKSATETTGAEVGREIKADLGKATEGATAVGTEIGNSVERGLKRATETTGTEVGREIKTDFSRALEGMSVDAFDEGRDAAKAAKLGAKSVGPVIIDSVVTGGGGGLVGGGGKAKKGATALGAADDVADAAKSAGRFGKIGAGLSKVFGGFGKVAGKLGLKALGKGFLAILGPIGALIGGVWMVIDVLGMFGIGIEDVINFFKNFSTEAPKLWGKITGAFSAAWDKIKEIFSGLWDKIKAPLEEFGNKVAGWFKDNWKTILMASNPIGLIILFFQNIWPKIQPKLAEFGKKVGDWFKELPSKISEAAGNMWGWITDKVSNIIPAIQEWWSGTFIPWIKGAPEQASEGGGNFWGWITDKVKDIVPAVTDWFTGTFIPFIVGLPGKILNLGINIFGWILDKAWDVISGLGKWLITDLIPWFLTLPFKIAGLAIDIFAWVVNKAVELIPKLVNWFTTSFVPWLIGLPGKIVNLAINIWGWIIDKAKGLMISLGNWLRDSFIPWIKGLPGRVRENVGNLFGSLKDKAVDGFNSLKTFFTDTVIPWVKGLPQRFVDGMKGLWDGLKSGAATASNWVTGKINEYIIPSLNKLPFVDLKPLRPIPGYASGGEVRGPDRGPRADNVLARLTPGEYVLTRKMVKQVGGTGSLEKWRRGGPLPQGGAKEWFGRATDWVGSLKPDFVDELLLKGAFHALNTLISNGLSLIPDKDGMIGLVTNYFRNNLELLRKFADKAQKGLDAEQAKGAGGPVEPYKGPADGWTYPLARRFPAYTRSGHNPWFAYDIGSPTGVAVRAVSSGVVTTSKDLKGRSYGQYITIVHHDKSRSLYAHLSKRFAKVGNSVRVGNVIGLSGNTGGSTGPHLHFELGFDDAKRMMARRGVKLASGGTVRATPGGVMTLLAEGGRHERVTPLDSRGRSATEVEMLNVLKDMAVNGRGGDTFQIFPAPGMSERELAVKVSREVAFRHRRRA